MEQPCLFNFIYYLVRVGPGVYVLWALAKALGTFLPEENVLRFSRAFTRTIDNAQKEIFTTRDCGVIGVV